MEYSVETALCGLIHVPSFMKFGEDDQAILRFCLRNLRVFNASITDGRYL
jgi:hypothetical protein